MESYKTLLQVSLHELIAKRTMLWRECGSISTLALGSSHGDFGFNPQYYPGSFNLCSASQDLKYSFHLYKAVATLLPNLKHILLFYSVFSARFFLEKVRLENVRCVALNEIFSLGISFEDELLSALGASLKGTLASAEVEIEGISGFFPNFNKPYFDRSYGVDRRAMDHLKYCDNGAVNSFLLDFIELVKSKQQALTIVLSPARADYKSALNTDSAQLFRSVFGLIPPETGDSSSPINLIDFFDTARFPDVLFCDFDHLNPHGDGPELLARGLHTEAVIKR